MTRIGAMNKSEYSNCEILFFPIVVSHSETSYVARHWMYTFPAKAILEPIKIENMQIRSKLILAILFSRLLKSDFTTPSSA